MKNEQTLTKSSNGQAKPLKVTKPQSSTKQAATEAATSTVVPANTADKKTRIHNLEDYCKQSLDKIGVLKILQEYSQKISELRNSLKESSGDIKVAIFNGHEEQLRVAKPDVIEDLLLLLEDRNNRFMDQLIDEIID